MSLSIIRTSETRDLLRCEWRWWKAWREGIRPIGTESAALWLGTGVHHALALWYCGPGTKRGPHPAETFEAWAMDEIQFIKTESRHKEDAATYVIEEKFIPGKELGVAMLEGYVDMWGRDEHMSVIQPEQTFQVDILDPRPKRTGRRLGIYAGTYDMVWRDLRSNGSREIKLEEHKTAKAIFTGHLPLDPQAGSYYAIARQQLLHDGLVSKGDRFVGIEYNFLRKALPDSRPVNAEGFACNKPTKDDYWAALCTEEPDLADQSIEKWTLKALQEKAEKWGLEIFGKPSANQPKPLFERLTIERTTRENGSQIARIQNIMLRAEALRKGKLPLTKNPTRDCSWDCSFYQLCLLDEGTNDAAEYQQAVYQIVDPYADHRKSTEE